MKYADKLEYVCEYAKNNGLVFKKQNARINGMQAYFFADKSTGQTVMTNCTLQSAFYKIFNGESIK